MRMLESLAAENGAVGVVLLTAAAEFAYRRCDFCLDVNPPS